MLRLKPMLRRKQAFVLSRTMTEHTVQMSSRTRTRNGTMHSPTPLHAKSKTFYHTSTQVITTFLCQYTSNTATIYFCRYIYILSRRIFGKSVHRCLTTAAEDRGHRQVSTTVDPIICKTGTYFTNFNYLNGYFQECYTKFCSMSQRNVMACSC